jgi:uncharacterized protein (AIM24 family)
VRGKCRYCGASQKTLDRGEGLETHAYAFIHTYDIKARIDEQFGDDMQFVKITLDPQETVVAEAGGMMYMSQGIRMEAQFGDGSQERPGFLDKVVAAGKRVLTGESLFMTTFTCVSSARERVAFAAPYPGKIVPIDLAQYGGTMICQKDSFLCAAKGTAIGISFSRKIGRGLFGGEGFIMQRLQGDGWTFLNAGGNIYYTLDGSDPRAIGDVTIATPHGELVRLANLASLAEERGPAQIDHLNRQRKVTLVANLDGIALGTAVDRVRAIVQELNLPPTYGIAFGGHAKSLGQTGTNFLIAFLLSFVFMYMILAAQFESFVHPITILLALPLSIPFALASLLLLNETLNIYSVLGLFMLFGIVKKNGILQVDYTNTLRDRGLAREEAILQANRARLRPILMTTMMLVASMIPIALGQGPGAAGRASMAKVIIGGQMLCLLLSLLVTPVSYSIFDDWSQGRFLRRKHAKAAEVAPVDVALSPAP